MKTVGSASVSKLDMRKKLPTRTISFKLQMVKCGRIWCKACPHGPYWYRRTKEGGKWRWKYAGKKRPAEITAEQEAAMLADKVFPQKGRRKKAKQTESGEAKE